jgi:hypothetical protein
MAPQLEKVAAPFGIPVLSSGGFDSVCHKHMLGRELADYDEVELLHIGDHDPSGVHVYSSLAEDVAAFAAAHGGRVGYSRLAVTPAQIEHYRLPTAPPKLTDKRSFEGNETTQAEALPPDVLAQILQTAIRRRIDFNVLDRVLMREEEIKAELRAVLAQTAA